MPHDPPGMPGILLIPRNPGPSIAPSLAPWDRSSFCETLACLPQMVGHQGPGV